MTNSFKDYFKDNTLAIHDISPETKKAWDSILTESMDIRDMGPPLAEPLIIPMSSNNESED